MASIVVEHYSEKAIVVRNTLEHHGQIMTELGGTFNEKLKGGRGWIFSKFKVNQVKSIVEKLNSGQYGNEFDQKVGPSAPITKGPSEAVEMVSKKEYLSLLTRVERLEALMAQFHNVPFSDESIVKPIVMEKKEKVASAASASTPVTGITSVKRPTTPDIEFDDTEDSPPPIQKRLVQIKK
jgi:hypothetical protein